MALLLCLSESAFSSDGRPLESAFYSGSTGYQNLVYEIFRHQSMADGTDIPPPQALHAESTAADAPPEALKLDGEEAGKQEEEAGGREADVAAEPPSDEGVGLSNVRPLVWVKKDILSNLLHEELSEAHVSGTIVVSNISVSFCMLCRASFRCFVPSLSFKLWLGCFIFIAAF